MRLIDADALKATLVDTCSASNNVKQRQIEDSILHGILPQIIDDEPTIEAEPVKHGRWVRHRIDDPKSILHGAVKDTTCSVCGKSTPYNTEYCMRCGSKQDLRGD